MKFLVVLISLVVCGQAALSDTIPEHFKGKYLFTQSRDLKIKEYNDVISGCFKLNEKAIAVLKTYNACIKSKGRQAPLQNSVGECSRSDGAEAFFFNTAKECEDARADTSDGAGT